MSERMMLSALPPVAPDGARVRLAGRLLMLSPASLALDDESGRRSFGFLDQTAPPPNIRELDVVEVEAAGSGGHWRVAQARVLTPCQLADYARASWRDRYLEQADRRRERMRKRAVIRRAARAWFDEQGFIELETPSLVPSPGIETHLSAFATVWNGPQGRFKTPFFLPTSTEFHLKRALVMGYEKIYELSRVWRNGEISALHQPEFTMLEWYRAHADYTAMMDDVENLVAETAQAATGDVVVLREGRAIALEPPWQRVTVEELFRERLGVALGDCADGAELAARAKTAGFGYLPADGSFEDNFFKLFLNEIEPKLGWERPTIVADYPAELAALSRRKRGEGRYCERFEVYIAGVELANAFGELTSPAEQRRRAQQFQDERQRQYGERHPYDEGLHQAMEFGMPPSAGIALGFDRLVMLLTGAARVDEAVAFPHAEPFSVDF